MFKIRITSKTAQKMAVVTPMPAHFTTAYIVKRSNYGHNAQACYFVITQYQTPNYTACTDIKGGAVYTVQSNIHLYTIVSRRQLLSYSGGGGGGTITTVLIVIFEELLDRYALSLYYCRILHSSPPLFPAPRASQVLQLLISSPSLPCNHPLSAYVTIFTGCATRLLCPRWGYKLWNLRCCKLFAPSGVPQGTSGMFWFVFISKEGTRLKLTL